MHLITVLLRIVLSAVFGTAGVTKLFDLGGTREAVKNFGAPKSIAPALSIALPIMELAIAAGLLFVNTTHASALGALLVLALFIVTIGISLARGRTHECHCFGQLYSRPLGWPTLVRNLVFALGAGIVFWQAGKETSQSIGDTLARLSSTEWLWLIVALLGAVAMMVYLERRRRHLTEKTATAPGGLALDAIAPEFELSAYAGGTTSLKELLAHGKPLLLIFTSPTCGSCVTLFEEIKKWQQAHSEQLTIALITMGTIKENFVNVARNSLGQMLLQEKREVAEKYGAAVTPTAVVVNTGGRIASPVAAGAEEIRKLLAGVVENSSNSNHDHPPRRIS
ncbi:MAG TPA: MauE/DoxX family redox-associated membrane protein [Pyrinomonadaceae bacterium]|jgi:peroxiredoxin|nr:MauE/DoxX family redox-associated membrane protein [Pyrinomonadaceae bacterium]